MNMKVSLQLKLGQQLTMTPQLQQAIRLLQLSTLDLQNEIQEALESNPMLELQDDNNDLDEQSQKDRASSDTSQNNEQEYDSTNTDQSTSANDQKTDAQSGTENELADSDWTDTIPDDLPVDTGWDDIYTNNAPSGPAPDDEGTPFEQRNSATESLADHLDWQLNLTPMSDRDRFIAMSLIDSTDSDGYLTSSIEEIHEGLYNPEDEDPVELDEVEAVLKRVQHFDPPGVFAKDLPDCLLLQLRQLPKETPWLPQAKLVISHYLNLLGSRDYAQLMRRSRLKEHELKEVISLIQSLNPKPGESIASAEPEYIVPDVVVKKEQGRWKVELNPEIAPKIRVNANYASFIKRADSSSDNTFMKDQLQEAKWFIKSLQSRNETLLKVASKIVSHQQGFLDYGDEAMKPLILHDIAEAVEMHESTISRVTTQKYMHTPRGIFELKYFFSSHVSTTSGGECSSTAIRAIIKKLISAENPKKPLSDSKIADLLKEQGINVARRTIAKYREAMSIPPSNERKRLV
jgi:RNA polymerase sigma-54 factor